MFNKFLLSVYTLITALHSPLILYCYSLQFLVRFIASYLLSALITVYVDLLNIILNW